MCLPHPDTPRFRVYNGLHVYLPTTEAIDDRPGYERSLARMDELRNTAANKRRDASKRQRAIMHRSKEVFPSLKAQDRMKDSVVIGQDSSFGFHNLHSRQRKNISIQRPDGSWTLFHTM